jgi:IS1 family transposase
MRVLNYCPQHRPIEQFFRQARQKDTKIHKESNRPQCRVCGRRYTRRTNTAVVHLKTAVETIAHSLLGVAEGLGLRATGRVFKVTPATVERWVMRAGTQGAYLMQLLFRSLPSKNIQIDELTTFIFKKRQNPLLNVESYSPYEAWVWVALLTKSRLVVAIHIGHRTQKDAEIFINKVFKRIDPQQVLFTSDRLQFYKTSLINKVIALKQEASEQNDSSMAVPHISYGRVVKLRKLGRVLNVDNEITWGNPKEIMTILEETGQSTINTAYVERFNLTLRQHTSRLHRRQLHFAKTWKGLAAHIFFVVAYYNFCRYHRSLRQELAPEQQKGGQKWHHRTPAMVAGVTDHRWSLAEFLLFQTPFTYNPYKDLPILFKGKERVNKRIRPEDSLRKLARLEKTLLNQKISESIVISDMSNESLPLLLHQEFQLAFERKQRLFLWITYQSRQGHLTVRKIKPVRLESNQNHIYLKSYCELRQQERSFRLDRIITWVVLKVPSSRLEFLAWAETYLKSKPLDSESLTCNEVSNSFCPRYSILELTAFLHPVEVVFPPTNPIPSKSSEIVPFPQPLKKVRFALGKKTGMVPNRLLMRIKNRYAFVTWLFLLWAYPYPQSVREITEGLEMAKSGVHQALQWLLEKNVIRREKKKWYQGERRMYRYSLLNSTLARLTDPG